jgi:hypothetical protein
VGGLLGLGIDAVRRKPPPRRGEDNLPYAVTNAVFQQPNGAEQVHLGVKIRFSYRTAHVHLGSLVRERLWSEVLKDLGAAGTNIYLIAARRLWDVLAPAAREVVDDCHLVSTGEEEIRHVDPMNPAPPVTNTLKASPTALREHLSVRRTTPGFS